MISAEVVSKVAKLSRLSFSEEELAEQAMQLGKILETMSVLQAIDTRDVEPMAHVLPVANIWREDVIETSMPKEDVLANGPDVAEGMFQVPKIV